MDNPSDSELEQQRSDSGTAPPERRTEVVVDKPARDAQEPQEGDSDSRSAPPNRPKGGAGQDQDPLIAFLRRLNGELGNTKTAKLLGVDRKTVWRALDAGRLTPRLRDALERERLAAEQEAAGADRLEPRVEGLERRLQDVEGQLANGLSGLREELAGVREEVARLAWTRPDGAPSGNASTVRSPHRSYSQVVTVEALPDDAEVFGEAMPLVAEWREQRARFKAHWPSVEGLEAEVRDARVGTGADRGTPPHPAARPTSLGMGPTRAGGAATRTAAGHGTVGAAAKVLATEAFAALHAGSGPPLIRAHSCRTFGVLTVQVDASVRSRDSQALFSGR